MGPIFYILIALPCTIGAITLAIHHIYNHLLNYTEPTYQRYIVRIIFMVPVSSPILCLSAFSLFLCLNAYCFDNQTFPSNPSSIVDTFSLICAHLLAHYHLMLFFWSTAICCALNDSFDMFISLKEGRCCLNMWISLSFWGHVSYFNCWLQGYAKIL